MKTIRNIFIENTSKLLFKLCIVLFFTCTLLSCDSDDIDDDSFFTFTGETVASFCESRENFSIFSQLLKETGNFTLLSTYGHYTCFMPNDSAFNVYFRENNIGYENLTLEEKKIIANNHIIRSDFKEYMTADFITGAIEKPNMNDRYLTISFALENGLQVIYINSYSPVLSKDNEVHNGVVHTIGRLIEPSDDYLDGILRSRSEFTLFSQAMELTSLGDSIQGLYDETYVNYYGQEYLNDEYKIPSVRKYGYTVLAESDEVFKKAGIETIEQLVQYASRYYGNEDVGNYKSRNNALNKFVAYHMFDRQMSTSSFIYNGECTSANAEDKRYEYYETMLPLRMVEFKAGNQINTLNDGSFVGIDENLCNIDGVNGFLHGLTDILVYDENAMTNDVLNKRIRFDFYAVPPQLTNNNIRWQTTQQPYTITHDYCGDHFKINEGVNIQMWGATTWTNHQEDEILISGWYDFTLRLLPVPPGTYELRFGYRAEDWRGVAQLYIDGEIVGIPVDLKVTGSNPNVGYVWDSETTDGGLENDKMMRNRGFMKAPNSIYSLNGPKTLRDDDMSLRVIIGTFTFQEYDHHYFRVRSVEYGTAFHCDYIEYVPVSYIDMEGID